MEDEELRISELPIADLMALARDAERYRWLRAQHWSEAPLCVVMQPRQSVILGHDCPTLERLDAAIDKAIGDATPPLPKEPA